MDCLHFWQHQVLKDYNIYSNKETSSQENTIMKSLLVDNYVNQNHKDQLFHFIQDSRESILY